MSKANWSQPFTVLVITREDLCTIGFPRWQAASLSDSEMRQIAEQMRVSYIDTFSSEHLESATNAVLRLRPEKKLVGESV